MKSTVLLLPFIFLCLKLFAQEVEPAREHLIHSTVFGADRKVTVYLPVKNPSRDSLTRFAVAYVFDGQFEPYTEMVSSMIRYYSESGNGVPMIVVGIHTADRWGEFVPEVVNGELVKGAGADQLSRFLSDEVFPLIESTYPAKPFRLGVGHSLGGTFVMHEIMKEQPLFQSVIAVSPNLTVHDEFLVNRGKAFFDRERERPLFIYTSAGTSGSMERWFNKSLSNLDTIYNQHNPGKIYWACERMEGEDHMTTFVPTFNRGYLAFSGHLMLTDESLSALGKDAAGIVSRLQSFYHEMNLFSGEKQELTFDRVMEHTKTLMDNKEFKLAFELCNESKRMLESGAREGKEKKELSKKIQDRLDWIGFNLLAEKAQESAHQRDYKTAAGYYKQAFDQELIKGTHLVRISSVPVLAQAGEIDLAFKQLELLTHTFQLGGNGSFIGDPLCKPLHQDPRWDKYMKGLAKNARKYE